MGNPIISQALVRDRARTLEGQATLHRQASDTLTAHLGAVRLFSSCGRKELRAIAKTAKVVTVHKGAEIITEGDEAKTMYVILSGTARVSLGGRRLSTVGPGDAFGELALLSKGPRTATVVALSQMEVAVISRRQLTSLLEAAPAFSRKLLESLADLVREIDKKAV